MPAQIAPPVTSAAELPDQADHRHGNRTPAVFSLFYSGLDKGQFLIADGIVTNLSLHGVGIYGNRLVAPGMRIALFVNLPGIEEPLCIAQSRVSWVDGRRFGVELGPLKLKERNLLRVFLWDRVTQLDHDRRICHKEVLS
ncbi:MAG: PilZ domain-containing protein [Nitrospirae bacterium]|nr:PilZ domain-containing protein [Nitrospirota bacterium]